MGDMPCQAFFEKKFKILIYDIASFDFLVFSLVFLQMREAQ